MALTYTSNSYGVEENFSVEQTWTTWASAICTPPARSRAQGEEILKKMQQKKPAWHAPPKFPQAI